jgi:hypothetical protein
MKSNLQDALKPLQQQNDKKLNDSKIEPQQTDSASCCGRGCSNCATMNQPYPAGLTSIYPEPVIE